MKWFRESQPKISYAIIFRSLMWNAPTFIFFSYGKHLFASWRDHGSNLKIKLFQLHASSSSNDNIDLIILPIDLSLLLSLVEKKSSSKTLNRYSY